MTGRPSQITLYQLVVLKYDATADESLHHTVAWGLPAVLSAALLVSGELGPVDQGMSYQWCWIRGADGGVQGGNTLGWVVFIDALRVLIFVLIALIYARVYCAFESLVHDGFEAVASRWPGPRAGASRASAELPGRALL